MLINRDVLDIAHRIKEIDSNYIIRYDKKVAKFKVLRRNGFEEIVECILPFDRLDERTIRHILLTRRENLDKLIEKIDAENAQLEIDEKSSMQKKIGKSIEAACSKNL